MRIQYLSHHSILEYEEVKLISELGYDIYANGSYRDPRGAYTLPRPGISTMKFDQQFFDLTAQHPKTNLPSELIEPYDVFIIMSGQNESVLVSNWDRIKHKKVIWRSIGQNTNVTERLLAKYIREGLIVVRYSPKERLYDDYAGGDALIRFYKDPDVYKDWVGDSDLVVNFTQSMRGRGAFVHYDQIMGSMVGFNSKVYGPGNEDLGSFNGGEIPFDNMLEIMRKARVFVYGGTWPACYTLSIIEAMMLGLPTVALGKSLVQVPGAEKLDYYEVDEIIQDGVNGFVGNSIPEIREKIKKLLSDYELAKEFSRKSRETAITLFGKKQIAEQWDELLKNI